MQRPEHAALRAVIAHVAILMALGGAAHAQGITLPSPRTVGPSPEVSRLVEMVHDAAGWIGESDKRRTALDFVRYRLLLAPFNKKDLEAIKKNPTEEEIWARLYKDAIKDGNASVMLAVLKEVRGLDKEEQERQAALIAFALAGSSADLGAGVAATKLQKLLEDAKATFASRKKSDSVMALSDTAQQRAFTVRLASTDLVDSLQKGKSRKESVVELTEREAIALTAQLMPGSDDVLRARFDTLGRLAQLVVIERKLKRGLFPVHSSEQSRVFWRQRGLSPLNVGALTGSSTAGASYTELASPLLHAFRLSLNTVFAASSKDASTPPADGESPPATSGTDTELSRFLNGGGLLNVAGAIPVLHAAKKNGAISSLLLFAPRVGMTIGALGAVQKDETAFFDPGIEWHINSADATEHVGFFAQCRSGLVSGGEKFASSLGMTAKNFGYTNVALGLLLGDRYLLSGGRSIGGPHELRKLGWQVGVTVLRGPQ